MKFRDWLVIGVMLFGSGKVESQREEFVDALRVHMMRHHGISHSELVEYLLGE